MPCRLSAENTAMSGRDIENFATRARAELQTQVELRAAHYAIADAAAPAADAWELRGRTLSALEREQRASVLRQVQERGLDAVVEEATYTWFNRFVALRFMEVNGYLETGAGWFSTPGQEGFHPEVLAQAHLLNLEGLELAEVERYRREDDEEGLFRYLFVLQCNALSRVLPRLFTPMQDWTLLLCPANLLRETGLLAQMLREIPEEDWRREVEIVGWMYQFYNSSSKAEVYAGLKAGRKVEKADIAPATQLFTPDWIVRYLVQNSLGRLWMDNHPRSGLAQQMEYYIAPEQPPVDFPRVNSPEELRVCDPACGSGHMLTYAFDLLYAIYEEEGYAAADIPSLILTHNLYGIDLDRRAGELAWFALMMKARSRDRRFLRRGVQPHVCVLEALDVSAEELTAYRDALGLAPFSAAQLNTLRAFAEADNFGSLIRPAMPAPGEWRQELAAQELPAHVLHRATHEKLQRVLRQAEYLSPRYHVIVANPPYMGSGNMNTRLNAWAKKNYPDSKSDLCAMFVERGLELLLPQGFNAMLTMHGWMFLSRFEQMRRYLLGATNVASLAHLGTRAFEQIGGAVVSTCAFVLEKQHSPTHVGDYVRLVDELNSEQKELRCREAMGRPQHACFFRVPAADFRDVPGQPLAYWLTPGARRVFAENGSLGERAEARAGMSTSDNDRFLRLWHEVSFERVGLGMGSMQQAFESGCRWFPLNKGGSLRKWYGNHDYVICFSEPDYKLLKSIGNHCPSEGFYFSPSVSWSAITGQATVFRHYPCGFVFESAAMCAFGGDEEWKLNLLAYSNTSYVQQMARIISPTINFKSGHFANLPYAQKAWSPEAAARARRLIELAKEDWDDRETSWNFRTLPLLRPEFRRATLAETWAALRGHWRQMTEDTARLEEENNRSFNALYELGEEFPAAVPPELITLTCNPAYRYSGERSAAELEQLLCADAMKELISYAVGCMFGRYSLEEPGLICAGSPCEPARYGDFAPDADNIIPICDEDYFPDDICGRFVDFVRLVFGEEELEENLCFIAGALGGNGAVAREVIRGYFLRDFYADHCRAYGKRPIYWQFDSGRKGGFRALVYLHRYHQDTLALMRTDYVFRQQERYRAAMEDFRRRAEEAKGRERVALNALLKKVTEQEAEIAAFEQQLHHLANQRAELELDAGVAANYARFAPILTKIR